PLIAGGNFTVLSYGGVDSTGKSQRSVFYAYDTANKRLYVRDPSGKTTQINNPTRGQIVAIDLDPANWMIAYVVVDMSGQNDDQVYKLTVSPKVGGGVTLNPLEKITGNLHDNHLDSIIVVAGPGGAGVSRVLFAGGHGGVYRVKDPAKDLALWNEFG